MTAALIALKEAVERGLPSPTSFRNFSAIPIGDEEKHGPILAHRAYHGSLDAAVSLLGEVLPGWDWDVASSNAAVVSTGSPLTGPAHLAASATPARAMLLAILSAMIADSETQSTETDGKEVGYE